MKLLRASKGNFQFHLAVGEKRLLCEVLTFYPCVPPAHHQLSKSGILPDAAAASALLSEALSEQRNENKRQLVAFLSDPARFVAVERGYRLSISPAEVEWLLQVLNDIRVGSWIKLGSPEDPRLELNEKNMLDAWAMELAGEFEMQLLAAVNKS
ncbi:MAG TPA: hypothetical protein VLT36_09750 [Candidatus Dormibacteraeota bacterium]|nr:hypothetical protein [Candidatus Dormibacteraeota bacterium]